MPKITSKRTRVTSTSPLGVGDLARALEINEDTVRRWVRAGAPHTRDKRGRYQFELGAVRDWHTSRRGDAAPGKMGRPSAVDGAPEDVREQIAIATLRRLTAQAEKIEHALSVTRGQYLSAAEVEAGRLARIAACKAGLLALPARMGARCANRGPLEVEQFAREEVERLLGEFAGGAP